MLRTVQRARSQEWLERAGRRLPGGVSSDVRMGGQALVLDRADGPYLFDIDGNRYVDYVLGMGPLVMGHNPAPVVEAIKRQAERGLIFGGQHQLEALVAEQIAAHVPCAAMLRFGSVGSEATHIALRLARAFTGRRTILKFEGHYHGWLDGVLQSTAFMGEASGPRERPRTVPMSGGIPPSAAGDMLVAPWNDADSLRSLLSEHGETVAAVIMEPIMCNTGCIAPDPDYLEEVQRLCRSHGALLIFDEVITGFRVGLGGAQAALGVVPDLATFGKAVAAGLPLSVVAGRADVMAQITRRTVTHAGTFNSNPLVMAGAHAALDALAKDGGSVYRTMQSTGTRLIEGIRGLGDQHGVPVVVSGTGSMLQVYFSAPPTIRDARDVSVCDVAARDRFVQGLLDRGIRITSRGLMFLSSVHGERELDLTLLAVEDLFRNW